MKICDLFYLSSGKTVFAVPIEEIFCCSISSLKAELEVDGQNLQELTIEGEFIMNAKHPKKHRAIFTNDSVNLTASFVKGHNCYLRLL